MHANTEKDIIEAVTETFALALRGGNPYSGDTWCAPCRDLSTSDDSLIGSNFLF